MVPPARRIRWLLWLPWIVLAAAQPGGVLAEESALPDADRAAIRAVIQRQLDAFRRDDAPAAFALASPAIQERFHDPATFLAMVRESYQAVYRPRHVTFLDTVVSDDQVLQKVLVIGPDGDQVLAVYPMAHMPDGSWTTDGCLLVQLPSKQA
jgi:hypothetical protein